MPPLMRWLPAGFATAAAATTTSTTEAATTPPERAGIGLASLTVRLRPPKL